MNKKLWLIEYEGSMWCGGSSHCVVEAPDADTAQELASVHMEEEMRELFADEYADLIEEGGSDEDCTYTVNSVEEFDETHECWKWYIDPEQSQFFPLVKYW